MRYAAVDKVTGAQQSRLLLEAFVLPPAEAAARWRRWREDLDLERLDPSYVRILPMLAHRLADWLAGDEARNTILGILKRAWTQNQIAFRSLAVVVGALREARIGPVAIIDSAAWALLYDEIKAIRPVDSLELLVRRTQARQAVDALVELGWSLLDDMPLPEGRVLDHRQAAWLRNEKDDRLKLSWRLLPSPPELAADHEVLPALASAEFFGVRVELLPPEEMLLTALGRRREPYQVDWKWDALALLAARPVDWNRMTSLMRNEGAARLRLRELRTDWRAAVPDEVLREPRTSGLRRRIESIWRDYRWHAWQAGAESSLTGLASYCARRWWKVFVTGRRAR